MWRRTFAAAIVVVILIAILVAAVNRFEAFNDRIVRVYQFDWVVESISIYTMDNNGAWPLNWDDLNESFRKATVSGACPWTLDEIRVNVQINFANERTSESKQFVVATGVNDQYVLARNLELHNAADSMKRQREVEKSDASPTIEK